MGGKVKREGGIDEVGVGRRENEREMERMEGEKEKEKDILDSIQRR